MNHVKTMECPSPLTHRDRWGFLASGRARLALAAAVLVCLVLGVDLLDRRPTGGLVWAEVLARVEEAEDFICRRIEKRSGEPAREIIEYRSARYGLRQEIHQQGRLQATQFVIPADRMLYALVHRDRTFMQMRLTDEQLAEHRRQSNARQIVRDFREEEYRSLGRKRLDGVWAEGIEVTDPEGWNGVFEGGAWRLWVDVETQWPVRIELEGIAAGGSVHKTYTLKDFQWNPDLTPRDFEVVIPDDYQLIADLDQVDATEEGALEGLRAYAKLMDGRYPSTLSVATAIAEAQQQLDGRHDRYDRAAGRDVKALFTIRNACNFYRDLVEDDRDPAYFGDAVGALDFDRVLLRWRRDDGDYRVVFGDLRARTVGPEELAELEAD